MQTETVCKELSRIGNNMKYKPELKPELKWSYACYIYIYRISSFLLYSGEVYIRVLRIVCSSIYWNPESIQ